MVHKFQGVETLSLGLELIIKFVSQPTLTSVTVRLVWFRPRSVRLARLLWNVRHVFVPVSNQLMHNSILTTIHEFQKLLWVYDLIDNLTFWSICFVRLSENSVLIHLRFIVPILFSLMLLAYCY